MSKRIVVTGCAGFIGSHLIERLLAEGHYVTGIDNFDAFYPKEIKLSNLIHAKDHAQFSFIEGDIRDRSMYEQLPENVDIVVHIAAKAGIRPSVEDPSSYIDVNIGGTQLLLNWMVKNHVKKLAFASSSSIYGNNVSLPFKETDAVDRPISPYAFTKRSCELLTHTFHDMYGISVVNMRFFTVYGPRQRPDLAIRKFIELIEDGKQITIYGDGNTSRDYTYIDDIVNGICLTLDYLESKRPIYEIINIGNGKPISLNDMVRKIHSVMGTHVNVKYSSMQPGDVDHTFADIEKAGQLLGYQPEIDLCEGLRLFLNWRNTEIKRIAS
jgi:nucleoside-diphosphate-sugar epimerase